MMASRSSSPAISSTRFPTAGRHAGLENPPGPRSTDRPTARRSKSTESAARSSNSQPTPSNLIFIAPLSSTTAAATRRGSSPSGRAQANTNGWCNSREWRSRHNTNGAKQTITFPQIADVPADTSQIKLTATSDANVPVRYFVSSGPAEVDGDTLKLLPIPPRAKYPLKVTVDAWQWGRSTEPKLQTAEPIERSFSIESPPATAK